MGRRADGLRAERGPKVLEALEPRPFTTGQTALLEPANLGTDEPKNPRAKLGRCGGEKLAQAGDVRP
ncbi:MAG TPA: hypothetical protein VH281_03375 [Gaiellaceae bacterium]